MKKKYFISSLLNKIFKYSKKFWWAIIVILLFRFYLNIIKNNFNKNLRIITNKFI